MRMRSSVILICLVASGGCGRLSAAIPRIQEDGAAQRKPASSSTSRPSNGRVLRDSYYECANSSDGSTWNIQSCIEAEFSYQDGRLNHIYRNLQAKLPYAERVVLQDDERHWLAEKQASCRWDASTDGQAQRIDANVCSLRMTADRADQLERKLGP
ncbi:MAG: lysozyme inhibitor LprI family protein [Luteimonas sp.]